MNPLDSSHSGASYSAAHDWTAEQPVSIIRPRSTGCSCAPRTPHSFLCSDPVAIAALLQQQGYPISPRGENSLFYVAIAALLQQQGYCPISTKGTKEHARLIRGGALAVIYGSGSVVGQGPNPTPLLELLAELAGCAE